MNIQLGINPLTWTNDDLPSLGAETPLEACLAEGKQAGYAGFELGNKFPRDPRVLKPLLAKFELKLVSGWYSSALLMRSVNAEIVAIQNHLNLLKKLDCHVMVLCETSHAIHGEKTIPISHRTPFPPHRWDEFAEKITALAEYTTQQGVQIAYHHHMGTFIQNRTEIDELMRRTGPEVGLLLDTGHLTYAGADPIAVAERWSERIVHVHCKDIRKNVLQRARNDDVSFLDAVLNGVFTVPGDGCIDYATLFKILRTADYQGWLVVEAEQDPSIATPLHYAKLGYAHLAHHARKAGLHIA